MKGKIAYAVGLVLVLTAALAKFHEVFSFKYGDGIYGVTAFYELEEDSVDVLVLGSSHAFENINPMVIWKDAGITVYDLCGSLAPLWNSYFFLEEALKTQSPKLVVLEAYCLTKNIDYIDDSRIIKNVYGLKPSPLKIEALKVSAPKERWAEFGLEYIQYHNRYTKLGATDYRDYQDNAPYYSCWKGMGNNFAVTPYEKPIIANDGTRAAIPEKQKEYYEKIIELCGRQNIPLLIIVSPYAGYNSNDMGIFNSAKDIAGKNGIVFENFNESYDEIGFDWGTDFADPSHMSYLGNARYSHYLSNYLLAHYEWEHHGQEQEKYQSWDKAVLYYDNSMEDKRIQGIQDVNQYGDMLGRLSDNYTVIVTVTGGILEDDTTVSLRNYFNSLNIPISGPLESSSWVIKGKGINAVSKSNCGFSWNKRFGNKELLIDDSGIYWNRENYRKTEEGINIVLFDEYNQTIADAVGISGNAIAR